MEESSNGKIEEIEKVEEEENDSKLGAEKAEQLKASVDGNSVSVEQSFDAEEKEKSVVQELEISESVEESLDAEEQENSTMQDKNLEESEKGKEEEEVINIIVNSDEHIEEPSVEATQGIGEIETESKGIDETETESKGIDETELESKGFDGVVEGLDETEDKNPTSSGDKEQQTASAAVIEESSPNETENKVVTRGIEAGDVQVEEKSTVVVDSLKPLPNAVIVGSNDAFPETAQDPFLQQRVMSVSQRTSWMSCCGLLQVLRRSNT